MCLNFLLNLSTLDYLIHLDNVHPQSRIFIKVPSLFILSLFERELRSLTSHTRTKISRRRQVYETRSTTVKYRYVFRVISDKRVTSCETRERRGEMSRVDLGRGWEGDEEDDEREHPNAAEEKRRRSRERGNDWQRRTVVLRYRTVKVPENNG